MGLGSLARGRWARLKRAKALRTRPWWLDLASNDERVLLAAVTNLVLALAIFFSMALIGERLGQRVFGRNTGLLESIFVGLTAVSSLLSLTYYFTSIPVVYALAILLIVAVPLTAVRGYRGLVNSLDAAGRTWFGQVLLSGALVVGLYLTPVIANVRRVSAHGGVLLAHIDLYTHASIIKQVALQAEIGNTQILLDGAAIPFYHYGLYMIPGALAAIGNWSPIDLLIYGVLPFATLALWVLVNEVVAAITGARGWQVLAASLLALLAADASRSLFYGNALFDLPYLTAASPGATFGLCIVLIAVKAIVIDKRVRPLPLLLCTFLLLEFRALYIPLFLSFGLLALVVLSRVDSAKKVAVVALAAIAATIAGAYLETPLRQYHGFMRTFFDAATPHDWLASDAGRVLVALDTIGATLGSTLLLLVAVAVGLAGLTRRWIELAMPLRLLLAMIVGYYCALQLAVTLSNGDITELMQRPFIVLNVVCAVLSVSAIYGIRKAGYLMSLAGAILLGNVFWISREYGFPKDHPWHQLSYKVVIEKDVVDLASWLALRGPRDSYVVLPLNRDSFNSYPEAVISALSGRRAFVSRLGFYRSDKGAKGGDIPARIDYVEQVANCGTGPGNTRRIYFVSKEPISCLGLQATIGSYRVYR